MAALVRHKARTRAKGWRPRDLAVAIVVAVVAVAVGVSLYFRERRLEAKRRNEQNQFIRDLDNRSMNGMNEAERQDYERRMADLEREYDKRADR